MRVIDIKGKIVSFREFIVVREIWKINFFGWEGGLEVGSEVVIVVWFESWKGCFGVSRMRIIV